MGPTLHVRLFGDFGLVYAQHSVTSVNTARLQSLLAYLVVHRAMPQSRRHLAFLLWPDSSEAQARTNLRRELHNLRHALPNADQFVCADARQLRWCPDAVYTLDVAEFEDALAAAEQAKAAGDPRAARASWEAAIAVYRGDLLPGCYDEWLLPERERLRQCYAEALERLVALLEEQREYPAAIRYAQRLLQSDPLREDASRHLMQLHALNNDRAAALHVYHASAATLQRELAVEPSQATRALYERLIGTEAVAAEDRAPRGAPGGRLPLIGRQHEWETLQRAWRRSLDGRAQLVCVAGEAGIGKSRLAEELFVWAGRQAIAAARTRGYPATSRLAYAPVTDLLRSDVMRAARVRLAPVWLSEVARLLPELLVERPDLPPPEPSTESWQRLRLFEAQTRAVLVAGQPLLLVIDDLQWCDQETLEWLRYLLQFDPAARLLVLGTLRLEETPPEHPMQALLLDLRGAEQVTEIELGPLDASETAALAAQVTGRELDTAVAARLYAATEGHPLFVVETLRTELDERMGTPERLATGAVGTPPDLSLLPPRVQAVIGARLARLSAPARELATLAATIGRDFTWDVLAAAADADDDTLVRGLDELWRRHVVREQGAAAYDFSHDKIREAAYADASTARRRLLHRQVAQALERVHASDLDAVSGQIAAHYERAGLAAQAIPYYRRAAVAAQQVYANAEAIDLLRRGLTLLTSLAESSERDEQELALQTALGVSLVARNGYGAAEVRAAYHRAEALGRRLDLPASPPVLRALAIASVARGEVRKTHELGEQLYAMARSSNDPILYTEAHYVLGVSLFWIGDFVRSRQHLEQAIAYYDRDRHRVHITVYGQDPGVICLSRLALTLWFLGDPDQARYCGDEALALARDVGHPLSQAYAMTYLAWIACERRDIAATLDLADAVITLCAKYRLDFFQWAAAILRGWALAAQGQRDAGIAELQTGITGHRALDQVLHLPHSLALLASAYADAGKLDRAPALLAEALDFSEQNGEHFYLAELERLQGELLRRQGADPSAVEQRLREALEIARRQEARSLELRAATSLSRFWQSEGQPSQAREVLAGIASWFPEGVDTPDLQAARELLAAVS